MNMLWHLDSFGPWVRSTSPSLHGCNFKHVPLWMYTRGAGVHLSSSPHSLWQTKELDPMIHSVSASLIFCSPSSSLPRSDGSCFSFCDKSSAIVVGFSVLSRTGKQGDNKKQETSSFLSPNYHCMIVNWVWLFRLTTVSESGFDHTPFRQGVVGGYHYHVTVSHQKDFWEMKSVWN